MPSSLSRAAIGASCGACYFCLSVAAELVISGWQCDPGGCGLVMAFLHLPIVYLLQANDSVFRPISDYLYNISPLVSATVFTAIFAAVDMAIGALCGMAIGLVVSVGVRWFRERRCVG